MGGLAILKKYAWLVWINEGDCIGLTAYELWTRRLELVPDAMSGGGNPMRSGGTEQGVRVVPRSRT
jgi:hypothetical protein